eukprot:11285378-Alexandrium_andersonii.AAC.1
MSASLVGSEMCIRDRFSLARPGPNSGRQGGVATLAPRPHHVVESVARAPGCCLDVTVRRGGERAAVENA